MQRLIAPAPAAYHRHSEGRQRPPAIAEPGQLRLAPLLLGGTRARAIAPLHFVRLDKGFVRQISKAIRGPKTLLAGIEHHRE